ncbi:MAG: gamma-glutamyltransferase [Candidatus Bathyarchaeota archaeon]|nr:MAG: gamma-glutamyltransferase [Candidatus Bathyarchaeota archaeon]
MDVRQSNTIATFKNEVVASKGVVAANHPLASLAGVEMLARGGNAFDAAVASLFALTVVEPMMVSMFGAGFFVYRDAESGEIETLDNYAVAPKAATEDMYTPVDVRQPGQGLFETVDCSNMVGRRAVATPGNLKAWEHVVEEYGELSFEEVISPAVMLARKGYRASEYLAYVVGLMESDIASFPETAAAFLPGGRAISAGDAVVMPDYAETLEEVAEKGSGHLYGGRLGRAVVDDMAENGGLLAMKDLLDYKLIPRKPIKGTYRDRFEICSMPPGSSGGTHIIQMLNMLEHFDVAAMGFASVEYVHLYAEVLKIAFADRQMYMGDPSRVEVPVEGLTSKEYAAERVKEIGDTAAMRSPGRPSLYRGDSGNTTHVSAMDSEGNMVAATQTLNGFFGSKVMAPGTGMLLNNCMALFDPRPGRANSVAGGKRMLSSMSPTIVLRRGEPFMCLGGTGGIRIFPEVCRAIVNVVDFGMSIQQAVEAPLVWTMGIPGTPGEKLHLESQYYEKMLGPLRSRGHDPLILPKIGGNMNGVLWDSETKLIHGGACWRADGSPAGLSGGPSHPNARKRGPPV